MSAARTGGSWLFGLTLLVTLSFAAFTESGCSSSSKTSTSTSATTGSSQFLYVSSNSANTTSAWAINSDASLTAVSGSPFPGGGFSVAADPKAQFLFTVGGTSLANPTLDTETIAANGSLVVASSISDNTLTGPISVNPSGSTLYVSSISAVQGNPGWKIYSIQSDGSLQFASAVISQVAGRLAFSADGSFAYSTSCYHLTQSIELFATANNALTGTSDPVPQVGSFGECPNAVAVSASGSMAAVPWSDADNVGPVDNLIAIYTIDSSTHALTPISGSPFPASGAGVDIAFDPSGKFVVVAQDNGIGVYQVGQSSVTEVSGSPFISGTNISRVQFSPNGAFVAAASNSAGQLYAFSFNSSTGALTAGPGSPVAVASPDDLTIH